MEEVRAYSIRIHEKAELSCEEFKDKFELSLKNIETGELVKKPYYKLGTGVDITEALKIDTIVYYMHNEIGLDLWGELLKKHNLKGDGKMNNARKIENRYDSEGVLIKEHDVLKDIETGEIAIVIQASNKSGTKGLAVENNVIGIKDWLDVYPNGSWIIIGNLGFSVYQ